jgi:hypothetical protein
MRPAIADAAGIAMIAPRQCDEIRLRGSGRIECAMAAFGGVRRIIMLRVALAALALTLPTIASAQVTSAGETGRVPERVRSVVLQGNDKCPAAVGDEVVVCSRINPEEQFRIPKELRNSAEPAAKNQSWVNRTAVAEATSRTAAGLPDTCSPVGTGGQSGCALMLNRAFAADKRAAEKNDAMVPGGGGDR